MAKRGFSYNKNEAKVINRIAKARGENRRSVALAPLEAAQVAACKDPSPKVFALMRKHGLSQAAAEAYQAFRP